MPQPVRDHPRQPVACLASYHQDLTAVMTLVRHEIGEHVADVEGQVAPDIPFRRRDLTPPRETELK